MLARLNMTETPLAAKDLKRVTHVLFILPPRDAEDGIGALPDGGVLQSTLRRREMKVVDLAKTPVSANLPDGALAVWVIVDTSKSVFEQQTAVRNAMQILLNEHPEKLCLAVFGSNAQRRRGAELGVLCAWLNSVRLPARKKKDERNLLKRVSVFGYQAADSFTTQRAVAEGNRLARILTVLAPNELTPKLYRDRLTELAKENNWKRTEYAMPALRKMGAGAFVAVAQGSAADDAAIVHLSYRPKQAMTTLALVGKGICFDTGGHNLKPAKYMYAMHQDMNGSAVAVGILLAATRLKLPLNIDCWLAIAQNHIGPLAYKQNDIVTALNGTTIEIIHTDAEGRMVLADTLTLAARQKPAAIIDFATLTGAMHVALGSRYCGIFSNQEELIAQALAAGKASGERVNPFPLDADYDPALDSKVADTKQCAADGEADHILAARFLAKFVDDRPWIHMDLSAHTCAGGLGAVASDVTGFGVGWGVDMLRRLIERE